MREGSGVEVLPEMRITINYFEGYQNCRPTCFSVARQSGTDADTRLAWPVCLNGGRAINKAPAVTTVQK